MFLEELKKLTLEKKQEIFLLEEKEKQSSEKMFL